MSVTGVATVVCLGFALAVVLVAGVRALRDRGAEVAELVTSGLLELAVLFYVTVRVIDLAGGHRTSGLGLTIAYLIGIVLTMPVAVALGVAERSRWGPTVIVVGALVVAVLLARIDQVWTPHG